MPGDWFVTASGRQVSVLEPRAEDISINDIAHALSHICRFGGHALYFYSVAQHSVFVSRFVSPGCRLAALLHDATEAYVGDMIRPLKRSLPDFKTIEQRFERVIAERFGLDITLEDHLEIKKADNVALCTERRDIGHSAWQSRRWVEDELGLEPAIEIIVPLSIAEARALFLHEFRDAGGVA